jgi:hypothetical protein
MRDFALSVCRIELKRSLQVDISFDPLKLQGTRRCDAGSCSATAAVRRCDVEHLAMASSGTGDRTLMDVEQRSTTAA